LSHESVDFLLGFFSRGGQRLGNPGGMLTWGCIGLGILAAVTPTGLAAKHPRLRQVCRRRVHMMAHRCRGHGPRYRALAIQYVHRFRKIGAHSVTRPCSMTNPAHRYAVVT
jgi:hypothetical protein